MADRRMFSKTVIDSDLFLEMPATTQVLYFHLAMRADDDGFVGNPKRIMRMVGASEDDMKILLAKLFILAFESGVIVIRHWKLHNLIKNDRYKETVYLDEKSRLSLDQNKVYMSSGTTLEPVWNQNGTSLEPQDSIGKDSINKDSIDKDSIGEDRKRKKERKRPLQRSYDEVIASFDLTQEVISEIGEFLKMRKMIKSPMTDRALELMIKKLLNLSPDPDTQIAILDQSIQGNWKGIFPLKIDTPARQPAPGRQTAAQQLEESYAMMARWAAKGDE